MDPNHRDRIAFLKICSGIFERNKNYLHVRSGKQMKFSSPTAFMAEKKSAMQEVTTWNDALRIQGCIAVQAGDIRLIDNIRIR
mgnify:CR=1 FL=1